MTIKDVRQEVIRLIKFNVIGVINTGIDFFVFYILTTFTGMLVEPAQVISYSAGVINSYFMNRFWTFGVRGKHSKKQFILFVGLNILVLLLSIAMIHILKGITPHIMIAKLLTTGVVMIANFAGQRLIVFKTEATKIIKVEGEANHE